MSETSAQVLARHGHLLSTKEREAIELVYIRGLSQRDAARALGIRRSSLRGRLENALEKLRLALHSEEAA